VVHVNVQEGERVRAGDPLIDGPIDPHDVLAVLGIKELQRYLVDKIQEVYRSQSVAINDKHIEVICRQMLRSVRVTRVGDTDFLVDEQVDRLRFMEENEKVMNRGGEPADGIPLLLGITKALSTDSFISAASFQETTGCSPRRQSPTESTTCVASNSYDLGSRTAIVDVLPWGKYMENRVGLVYRKHGVCRRREPSKEER
jgi:hypothetical protein